MQTASNTFGSEATAFLAQVIGYDTRCSDICAPIIVVHENILDRLCFGTPRTIVSIRFILYLYISMREAVDLVEIIFSI